MSGYRSGLSGVLSGEANTVLKGLITRMGLEELFEADSTDSQITIKSSQMDRYIGGYTGIRKMLKAAKAKLKMIYKSGKVQISAVPLVDYSTRMKNGIPHRAVHRSVKTILPTNHVICLGKGDLKRQKGDTSVSGCKRGMCQKHSLILAFRK